MEQLKPPAMPRLALIDVLDRDGRARQSLPVTQWPVRIGRALDNDLVLDDPSVAAYHCHLGHAEGAADPQRTVTLFVDATQNGVVVDRKRVQQGGQRLLISDQEWQAGQTRMRVRLAAAPVTAEQAMAFTTGWGIFAIVFGLLALVALTGLNSYLTTIPGEFLVKLVKDVLAVILVMAVWALLWALISKMFRHKMFFWQHVKIAAWASVLLQLAAYLLSGVAFALSWPLFYKLAPELPWFALAAVLFAHLAIVLPKHKRLLGATTLALLVGLLGVSLFMRHEETGRWLKPLYSAALAYPGLRLAPAHSVDALLQQAGGMEQILQLAAQQEGSDDDDAQDLELE